MSKEKQNTPTNTPTQKQFTNCELKQIEEMAKALNEATFGVNTHTLADHLKPETINKVAEYLYNAGYRKQNEGHWFILEYEYFTCPECGYYHPNGCDTTKEAKEKLANGIYPKYCAECGAKMKGGAEG